jgi:hypothetical protein
MKMELFNWEDILDIGILYPRVGVTYEVDFDTLKN